MPALAHPDLGAELPLLHATMRINAAIFGVILGLILGLGLLLLALVADLKFIAHAGLGVALIGVFLPLYGASAGGAFAGLAWGCLLGALLGASIYWLNCRHVLRHVEELVALERTTGDFPVAVLRLHGPSLGLALGTIGVLGLLATTNFLVLRGTADESIHAKLIGQILPGYAVSPLGSVIGAAELFALVYIGCIVFAWIYNGVVALRRVAARR